jgi:hypothetical protein
VASANACSAPADDGRTVVASRISWAMASNTATIDGRIITPSGRPRASELMSGSRSARRIMS